MDQSQGGGEGDSSDLEEYCGWEAKDTKNADLKLISSDNMVLWVQSSVLARYSPVFKSMLATCEQNSSGDSIHLSDAETETAATIEGILLVVETLERHGGYFREIFDQHLDLHLICFAKKYDMRSILDAMKLYLFGLVTSFPPEGGESVLVAAALREWDLCGRIIITLDQNIGRNGRDTLEKDMRKTLDWRGWTPETMREITQIDENLPWAIIQAGTKHAKTSGYGRISYAGMGPDLAEIMKTFEHGGDPDETWVQQGRDSWWE